MNVVDLDSFLWSTKECVGVSDDEVINTNSCGQISDVSRVKTRAREASEFL